MKAIQAKSLELHIPADTRYISLVRRGVRSLAESAGFAREEVADVEVAVCEAVANSVEHGSAVLDAPKVIVKCRASQQRLDIEVEDQGAAAEVPKCRFACSPSDERGRGIMMMHALMDECEGTVTEHGLRVRMTKQRAL